MEDRHFQKLKKTWDEWGKRDPFAAILTPVWDEGKANEFFETGVREIEEVMKHVETIETKFSDTCIPRKKALDFGCGIGRLAQALAGYFDEVHGVDIAPSMIDQANRYNSQGDRCKYHLNVSDSLDPFPDDMFDFIYSSVVLMHMETKYARVYVQELLRVLSPGGLLMFQYLSRPKLNPSEGGSPSKVIKHLVKTTIPEVLVHSVRKMRYERLRQKTNEPVIEMYWMKRKKVERFLEKIGARTLSVIEERVEWPSWISCLYCVTK